MLTWKSLANSTYLFASAKRVLLHFNVSSCCCYPTLSLLSAFSVAFITLSLAFSPRVKELLTFYCSATL